jgi:hypothetical protein
VVVAAVVMSGGAGSLAGAITAPIPAANANVNIYRLEIIVQKSSLFTKKKPGGGATGGGV